MLDFVTVTTVQGWWPLIRHREQNWSLLADMLGIVVANTSVCAPRRVSPSLSVGTQQRLHLSPLGRGQTVWGQGRPGGGMVQVGAPPPPHRHIHSLGPLGPGWTIGP